MSLPAVFGTTVDTVPWPGPYLEADADEAREKRIAFPDLNPGPRIGLAWAGNPALQGRPPALHASRNSAAPAAHHERQLDLAPEGGSRRQLSALPADQSLRNGPGTSDGSRIQDGSSRDRDLAETAALLSTLDLVITTDTSIAHLAGAMAKPVWILLPHLADWRWMQQVETTPWYPTARLFRQPTPGDWPSVLNRVAAELQSLP